MISKVSQEITIKSCNVLYEDLYQKYAKDVEKIDSIIRRTLLIQSFNDVNQLASADILCFQEWDVLDHHRDLIHLLKSLDYAFAGITCNTDDRLDGLVIAWKTALFEQQHETIEYSFIDNRTSKVGRRAIGVTLRSLKTGTTLHVVSLHAAFILGYEKRYESVLAQLNVIKAKSQDQAADATFICGDFNYNIHSNTESQYPNKELSKIEAEAWYPKLVEGEWCDSRHIANYQHPTAYGFTGFETLDYILFKGRAELLSYSQYPENPTSLIKHSKPMEGEGPHFQSYFSDHSIISATFKLHYNEEFSFS